MIKRLTTDVLIAGGGPVGRTLGCLLQREGVDTMIIEKIPIANRKRHPKAHALTSRTMEIFNSMGISEDIMKHCPPESEWGKVQYTHSLQGKYIAEKDHRTGSAFETLIQKSECRPAHVAQPYVEDALQSLSANLNLKEHVGTCVTINENYSPNTVLTTVSTPSETYEVESEHVVVADGANSSLRSNLGIAMSGPGTLQKFHSIHFNSLSLGRYLIEQNRTGMLYFVFNSDIIACVVGLDISKGEFVIQIPSYDIAHSDTNEEQVVRTAINAAVYGTDSTEKKVIIDDLIVHARQSWIMSAQIAQSFVSKSGKCFLCGDAAHRFPPSGGLGLNTGIGDAHNIAWKLSAYHKRYSDSELLHSYHKERHYSGTGLLSTAMTCFQRGMNVPKSMGMTQSQASILETVCSNIPYVGSHLFDTGMKLGRTATTNNTSGVQNILNNWNDIPLFFSFDDLGVCYPPAKRTDEIRQGSLHYTEQFMAGVRMPSISYKTTSGTFERYSMPRSLTWVLLSKDLNINIRSVKTPCTPGVSVIYVASSSQWDAIDSEIKNILVRPDGYIAWVSDKKTSPREIRTELRNMLFSSSGG